MLLLANGGILSLGKKVMEAKRQLKHAMTVWGVMSQIKSSLRLNGNDSFSGWLPGAGLHGVYLRAWMMIWEAVMGIIRMIHFIICQKSKLSWLSLDCRLVTCFLVKLKAVVLRLMGYIASVHFCPVYHRKAVLRRYNNRRTWWRFGWNKVGLWDFKEEQKKILISPAQIPSPYFNAHTVKHLTDCAPLKFISGWDEIGRDRS